MGCEQAHLTHFCYPITLVLHQHLNSNVTSTEIQTKHEGNISTCHRTLFSDYSNQAHGGGRVVSASGSETSVSSSTPTSAIIYDAYTFIIKKRLL